MNAAALSLIVNAKTSGQVREAVEATSEKEQALRETAREFEAVFIKEMLTHAGLDKAIAGDSGYGGEAFSSMLVETYAEKLAEKGGFGLADQMYRQLKGQLK
ncbi:rod-binding protein [Hyphococcus sp.]|uniref:rod-binding protein n=1 Tax=Hyphococcus sp. TaxID=2038636 RepID=UPI003D0FDC6A